MRIIYINQLLIRVNHTHIFTYTVSEQIEQSSASISRSDSSELSFSDKDELPTVKADTNLFKLEQ